MSKKYIVTNDTEITELNVKDWIDNFNNSIQPKLIELNDYYEGKDNISKSRPETRREENNIHVNLSYMIVNQMVSYCFGKPMTYDFRENYEYEKYIRGLQYKNQESSENVAIEKDCSKYGLAYEFIGVDENKEPFYKRLNPLNTFKVVDDSIIKKDVCVITYSVIKPKNQSEYKKGYIYTKEFRVPFTYKSSVTFDDIEENIEFPDTLPIVTFKNNNETIGDFEMVLEPLSAYSKLTSRIFDNIDQVADALLLFYNAELSDEEKAELNKTRVVGLQGEGAKAEYIYKKADVQMFKELRNALKDDILLLSFVPDMSDVVSYQKSASAVRYKLVNIEATRQLKSIYMEQGLRQRLHILSKYILKQFDIERDDVKLQFYSNLPANIDADLDLLKLVKDGGLSLESYLEKAETVQDSDLEFKRLRKEKVSKIADALIEVNKQIKTASDEYDNMQTVEEIPLKSGDA